MARVMSKKGQARQGRTPQWQAWGISPEDRQRIVSENAYYRAQARGFAPGHEVEDWVAAEEQFERLGRRHNPREVDNNLEIFGTQHGGPMSPAEDDLMKRTLKARSAREIPRVESIPPEVAPRKE